MGGGVRAKGSEVPRRSRLRAYLCPPPSVGSPTVPRRHHPWDTGGRATHLGHHRRVFCDCGAAGFPPGPPGLPSTPGSPIRTAASRPARLTAPTHRQAPFGRPDACRNNPTPSRTYTQPRQPTPTEQLPRAVSHAVRLPRHEGEAVHLRRARVPRQSRAHRQLRGDRLRDHRVRTFPRRPGHRGRRRSVDEHGRIEDEFATLINPEGPDTGPVFIHGIITPRSRRRRPSPRSHPSSSLASTAPWWSRTTHRSRSASSPPS